MKKYILLLIVGNLMECKEEERSWVVPQLALKFAISDSNKLFSLYPKQSMVFGYTKNLIYYDIDGMRKEMGYVRIGINEQNSDPKYYISVGNIAEMSSIQDIKTYYIIWPNGEKDTLLADYKREHGKIISENNCGCNDPLVELKLNGKSFIRKTNYDINGIYIFDR